LNPWVRRAVALVLFLRAAPLAAEIPLYQNGSDFKLELGIRAQIQYYHLGGEDWSEEKLYFRRLRPVLNATFSPRWEAEAEFDFGETVEGEAVEFKDMVVSYLGWEAKGVTLSIGNDKAVFSRQLQSSSRSLTLVERGLVGIDDFGSLDRVLGVRVDGRDAEGRFKMAGSVGLASHEPDPTQMEFESPLNARDGFDRGWSFSGRAELTPLGDVDYDQGDFGSEGLRFALSAAAYRWLNDGSGSTEGEGHLDASRGVELSAALRGRGLSADAEVQWIRGETTDSAFTSGLYEDGEATLSKLSMQSGYMVIPEHLEIVGGFDRLDAATYASVWRKWTLGATHYWKRERLKLQLNYILHRSFLGIPGDDPHAVSTQLQLVF
jgi:hypothetical protein